MTLCAPFSQYDLQANVSTWLAGANDNTVSYPAKQGLQGCQLRTSGVPRYRGVVWSDPSGGLWYGFGYTGAYCNGRTCNAGARSMQMTVEACAKDCALFLRRGCVCTVDFFYIPSGSAVLSLQLTPAAGAVVVSPADASARAGVNNITLGRC
jgi:hypothetical protein